MVLIFFSTGQVLLSALSWYSACTSLKVYFRSFVEGDVLCIHLLLCHLVLTPVKWFFQPSFSSQIFVWDLAQNFLADFSYKQHKGYKRSYQNRSLLCYDDSVSRRWPSTPWLLSSPKPLLMDTLLSVFYFSQNQLTEMLGLF